MRRFLCSLLFCGLAATAAAQGKAKAAAPEADFAVAFNAQRRDLTSGGSFWEQGGSADFSIDASHGFGVAAVVSGGRAVNLGGAGVNLTTVTATFGPRYTWSRPRFSLFAEGLLGESNALDSVFPSAGGVVTSTNSFAEQAGGGLDVHLSRHFGVRVMQASWLRTQFPNATTNVQNTLQLGAGIVLRLRR